MRDFSFDGRAFKKGVTKNAVSLKAESVGRANHTSDRYLKLVLKKQINMHILYIYFISILY